MAKQSPLSDELINKLREEAEDFARKIAAGSGASELQQEGAIRTRVIRHRDGTVTIEMWGDRTIAPMARAQERGSGIHRKGGRRSTNEQSDGTILIRPKDKKLLAFHWDKVSASETAGWIRKDPEDPVTRTLVYPEKFRGIADDGRLMFSHVNHPGVPAINGGNGYMRTGAADALYKNQANIVQEMVADSVGKIRVSFAKRREK